MKCYKYILDGKIIDATVDPIWVKQDKNNLVVRCDVCEAVGVVSSDMTTILHIAGAKPFIDSKEYDEVFVADITSDEYEKLQVLLGLGAKIPENDEVEWEEEPKEPDEILEDKTLEEVRKRQLEKLGDACQKIIYNGIDVHLSNGDVRHFDLKIEDQLNLLTLSTMVSNGENLIPYHASNELCTYYSAEDIINILKVATEFKTYHTTYYNSLKNWVMSMNTIAEIGSVEYGDEVPAEYCSDILLNIIESSESGLNEEGN